jgi:hypothetical protein
MDNKLGDIQRITSNYGGTPINHRLVYTQSPAISFTCLLYHLDNFLDDLLFLHVLVSVLVFTHILLSLFSSVLNF